MIQSCRLEAMLAAESCHLCGRCYRNSSSCRPLCCGNYMVTVGRRRPQLHLNKMICVLVCMAVSQFLLFLLFLNKQAGKSSHLGHYLTSNNNVTNSIQPLNVLLIKMKKKNIIPVIFTCWNYTQAQNGASVRRHRPARSSGMHRECCDFCI